MARCCLRRIGWDMLGPSTWQDDLGAKVDLSVCSPALVGLQVKQGVQRHLERNLAKKLGMEEDRACVDLAAAVLRSSKYDARQKYHVVAFVTDGLVSEDKAIHRGYIYIQGCVLYVVQ